MGINKLRGNRVISGSWGELWWNNDKIFDVSKFEAKVTAEREDVIQGGSLDIDSKLVALKGEGSFTCKRVYSRGIKNLIDYWIQGKDPRSVLIGKLDDPDSYGAERIVFNNVWFSEAIIMTFEGKKVTEEEFKFNFTVSDVDFQQII